MGSGDPRVFGPDAWRSLHRFSIWYPESPNDEAQRACRNFVAGLPYMLPCAHCGYHLQEFIVFNEHFSNQSREKCLGKCTSAEEICGSQDALVDFFARAHNNVNILNNRCLKMWNKADVYKAYESEMLSTRSPIDGKCQLMKSS